MTAEKIEYTGERLLSCKAAAARLGRTVKTLENWRWKGTGPKFKTDQVTGRFMGYPESEIERFLATDVVSSTAEAKVHRRKHPTTAAARRRARALLDLGPL